MEPLSKEAERRLTNCLRDVNAEVTGGLSPTDAVTKIAEAEKLSTHFVHLVCRAYNTGSTTRQREDHEDVLGKVADFAIADADAVLERMYPDRVKKASFADDEAVDAVYLRPPTKPLNKAALFRALPRIELPKFAGERPRDQERRNGELHRVTKAAEYARIETIRVDRELRQHLDDLSAYFKKSAGARESFHTFQRNVELLFGKTGAAVLDYVKTRSHLDDKALAREKAATYGKVNLEHIPYSYVSNVVRLGGELIDAQRRQKEAADKKAGVLSGLASAAGSVAKGVGGVASGAADAPSKLPGLLGERFPRLTPKPNSELLEDAWLDLEDPRHANAMRGAEAQAMLTDLLANDEVISGYGPEEVLKHYNEISQLHPHAANSPILMRPLLRKALSSGGLEPFETGEMAKTEQTINKTKNLTPSTQGLLDAPASLLG